MKKIIFKIFIILIIGFASALNFYSESNNALNISFGQELRAMPMGDWCQNYKSQSTAVGSHTIMTSQGPQTMIDYADCCAYAGTNASAWCNQSKDAASCPELICETTLQ